MHLARPVKPRLEPIPAVAAKAREAMKDQPINAVNVTATMAHNRTMARAIGKFAQTVLFDGELPRRQVELAVLRMGWNCQSVYEFGQHTLFGRHAGLSDDEVYLTTRPVVEGSWSGADAVILQLVDDLYTDDCVSDATWAEATHHFTTADVIHLIAAAGCYRAVSGFLNSAGVQLDDGVPGWPTAPRS
ncbi:MAG: 4-carboxymuconolactone decarboxylase [Acidimicrobiaceae bacterium]|jgi:alkylhydroperoxidase family enzyme|nr:4-carboxymuconolactone decarboxylase [Acidimicrobiaceae bacterium]